MRVHNKQEREGATQNGLSCLKPYRSPHCYTSSGKAADPNIHKHPPTTYKIFKYLRFIGNMSFKGLHSQISTQERSRPISVKKKQHPPQTKTKTKMEYSGNNWKLYQGDGMNVETKWCEREGSRYFIQLIWIRCANKMPYNVLMCGREGRFWIFKLF